MPGLATAMSIAPWVPVALIGSAEVLGLLLCLSLFLCACAIGLTLLQREPIRALEVLDIAYVGFVAVLAIVLPSARETIAQLVSVVSIAVVFLFMVVSFLRRRPFTAPYTASVSGPGVADPSFIHANMRLTRMWVAVFGVQLCSTIVAQMIVEDPNSLLFGWAIPIASLVIGFILNEHMTRRIATNAQRSSEVPSRGGYE